MTLFGSPPWTRVPAATLVTLGALAPVLPGQSAGIRSGSQLGAKQLSNSKGGSVTFERAEAVGNRPLHSAHGRIHDYRAPSAPRTRLLHSASLPVTPMPEAGLGSRGYDSHAQYL